MTRVALVEDDPLIRAGVAAVLSAEPDLDVVGLAADGDEAVGVVTAARPDVLVMDLRMPRLDGVTATRAVCALPDAPPVLVLTTFEGDPDVLLALRAGASGYLLKRNVGDLARAVRQLAAGETWLDPAVAGQVLAALAALPVPGSPDAVVARLTGREREVLALLAQGLSNAELAQRLYVGVGTIKTHVSRILFKTGCRDRAQATALAFTSGLVVVR
ncbi:response regulator [Micropruina sonneratiae]|uniref:response regulator n=1 Tax=Micropruina sonneratiae TaxID=2986940 RepID=UPI00222754DA|nr:response regulator transcription factor [Micropruina sp. KQZ13P-5]MCW3159548.1 response regulator transcription factor [Micropruina sp. KQZ13P-5]